MEDFFTGTLAESVFDHFSYYHVGVSFVLTLVLSKFLRKKLKVLAALGALVFIWELLELVVFQHINWWLFWGGESWRNKLVGDTLADLAGYLVAILLLRIRARLKDQKKILVRR